MELQYKQLSCKGCAHVRACPNTGNAKFYRTRLLPTFAASISVMQFSFYYQKNKVIQGLRYHFITRPEIKALILVINVFAIASAVLFFLKKIQPQPFILSSFVWMVLLVVFWFVLPAYIYRKSATFKDSFTVRFVSSGIELSNERGSVLWSWGQFVSYFESPAFIHLYFSSRSFFMVPKDGLSPQQLSETRSLLQENIRTKK